MLRKDVEWMKYIEVCRWSDCVWKVSKLPIQLTKNDANVDQVSQMVPMILSKANTCSLALTCPIIHAV